jgi:MSHA biogenesis protein MshQ
MLRRGRWGAAAAALLLAGAASAANVNFNGSNTVPVCPLTGSTYTCAALPLGANDTAVISSGYTVVVNSDVALAYAQGLSMSGSAALRATGNIDLSASNGLNVSGGALIAGGNFKLGSNAQSITANVTAATLTTGGSSTYIGGSVTTSGNINLGSSSTITGAVTSTAGSITTNSSVNLGPLSVAGSINLGSSNTINGAVSGGSITTNSSVTMGALTIANAVNLGSSNTINGSVSATSITTNSSVTINGSITLSKTNSSSVADLGSGIKVTGNVTAYAVKTNSPGTINGAIDAATTIDLGSSITVGGLISGATVTTNSPVTLNGGVKASVSLTVGSGSSITGDIVAPVVTLNASNITVKGAVTATTSLDMGSGTAITGTVKTGNLTMRASNAVINGNATVTGDVDMGSGTTINGDLSARNVNTRASNAVVNGNAAVNSIYIDWGNSVTKTITCTGPGAALCSCVTKADPNYKPTCGAAPSSGADHIQITHNGQGLTCQGSPVTLRACADANCTSTYNGSTTVTLTPGGGQVTFTGTGNAMVYDQKAETAALSAGANTSCINSASSNSTNQCNMTFSAAGVQLAVPDHVSMSSNVLMNIQALKAGPNNASCVPLAQGPVQMNFSCGYKNPASGTAALLLGSGDKAVACNGGTTPVGVTLDSNGVGTLSVKYPDVGLMSVGASYSTSAVDAAGSTSFTAAPASFQIVGKPSPDITINKTAFARASDPFVLKVSAVNAKGDVTPNFGQETPAQSFTIGQVVLKFPSDGEPIVPAMLTQGTFARIAGGIGQSNTDSSGLWVFRETGVITLNAALSNSSTYYLNTTATGFKTVGTVDLRFAPHHFDTVLLPGAQMPCAQLGGYSNPCAKPYDQGNFLYAKQGFNVQLNAYKDATTLSKNYRLRSAGSTDTEDVARAITLSAANVADGSANTVLNAVTPSFLFAKGVGLLNGSALPALDYVASQSPPAVPGAPATIFVRAADSDGATSARSGAIEAPLTIVSGKMMTANAYGPTTAKVPVEVRAMYYSAAAKTWLFNPLFPTSGTPPNSSVPGASFSVAADGGVFKNCNGINCAAMRLVPSTVTFANGKAMFMVAPPNASGWADVSLNPTPTNAAMPVYLPVYDTGRLTFGTFRSGPVIYTREVYN